jgi:hypothetical protein
MLVDNLTRGVINSGFFVSYCPVNIKIKSTAAVKSNRH